VRITYLTGVTLVASLAPIAGTDAYGTSYPAGLSADIEQSTTQISRMNNENPATLISTDHALQIGIDANPNLRLDSASINSVSGGIASRLGLNTINDGDILTGTGLFETGGNTTVDGSLHTIGAITTESYVETYNNSDTTTYTPVLYDYGTATFSVRRGWWTKIANYYFVNVYCVANNGGSGTNPLRITMPFDIERTNRQLLSMSVENLSVGGVGSFIANGNAISMTSGTGTIIDRMRVSKNNASNSDGNILGQDIINGTIIVIQGWIRLEY
jgi:hypothetical protein